MPRIIVTADPDPHALTEETPVLLDEHVHSVHLSTHHAAAQLVERLAWAVADAENADTPRRLERGSNQERRVREELQARRGRTAALRQARSPVAA